MRKGERRHRCLHCFSSFAIVTGRIVALALPISNASLVRVNQHGGKSRHARKGGWGEKEDRCLFASRLRRRKVQGEQWASGLLPMSSPLPSSGSTNPQGGVDVAAWGVVTNTGQQQDHSFASCSVGGMLGEREVGLAVCGRQALDERWLKAHFPGPSMVGPRASL